MYDLTGQKFGNLTAIDIDESDKRNGAYWNCICGCGNKTKARSDHLRKGLRVSCGCFKKRKGPRRSLKERNKCSICGIEKSPALFYKNKGTYDGLSYACKKCSANRVRKYKPRAYDYKVPRKKATATAIKQKKIVEYGKDVIDFQEVDYDSSMSYGDAMREIKGY